TIVQEDLTIDLPADRDQLNTRALPRFTELRHHVYEQIQLAKKGHRPAAASDTAAPTPGGPGELS
ncbi:MAG: NitT/TauT family transport system ATP-binding protein, partial [Actinomycetota bacterium]|nr:NitT/TauT family transport system ATP-binding protein [Actinomycetota bacterium]